MQCLYWAISQLVFIYKKNSLTETRFTIIIKCTIITVINNNTIIITKNITTVKLYDPKISFTVNLLVFKAQTFEEICIFYGSQAVLLKMFIIFSDLGLIYCQTYINMSYWTRPIVHDSLGLNHVHELSIYIFPWLDISVFVLGCKNVCGAGVIIYTPVTRPSAVFFLSLTSRNNFVAILKINIAILITNTMMSLINK